MDPFSTVFRFGIFAVVVTSLFVPLACARPEAGPDELLGHATSNPVESSTSNVAPIASFIPPNDPHIPMPGPRRKRLAAAVALNATCTSCHEEETKEWRGSYHQRANVDPAYVRAFAIEPTQFCRGCHAPEADPKKEPPQSVSELGVGCVTCHVTEDGLVLAADHGEEPQRASAAHPIRRSKAFAHQGGCANCHEFRFPMPGNDDEDAFFMQTTAREHLRSPSAAKACADCHMPLENGRRSHSFAHVRDPAWLRKNLEATAKMAPNNLLQVTLVQPNPGHDAPTGDLFRRYEVGYELQDASGKTIHRATTYLARHFELLPNKPGRTLVRDDRVTSEPRVVEMELPPNIRNATRISWWVTYQRVATVGAGTNPADAAVESSVELHHANFAIPDSTVHESEP